MTPPPIPVAAGTLAYAPQVDLLIALGVVVALFAATIWVLISFMRDKGDQSEVWPSIYAEAERKYNQVCEQNPLLDELEMNFVFYTYSGVLVFFTQSTHKLRLPARHAAILADDLHAYNLRKCLIPYPGILYVPLLSWLNRRKIRRAAQDLL